MTIVETTVTHDRASLSRRIERRHTKDHLAWVLAGLWDIAHDVTDEDEKRRLLDELMRAVY